MKRREKLFLGNIQKFWTRKFRAHIAEATRPAFRQTVPNISYRFTTYQVSFNGGGGGVKL